MSKQLAVDVRPGLVSRARADSGDLHYGHVEHRPGCAVAAVYGCLVQVDCRCGGPVMHTLDGHEVIVAELVACTLGQRVRPELRMSRYDVLAARMSDAVRAMWLSLSGPGTALSKMKATS